MSYDVSIYVTEPHEVDSWNHTYNCGAMFQRALGGDGIYDLNNKQCKDVLPLLRVALSHISNPDNHSEYEEMNPPNGWGSHKTAIEFLEKILLGCSEHPEGIIRVS